MTTAQTFYTNANLFFDKKKNRTLAKIRPSSFLWYVNFGEKGYLQRNGMAAIPKTNSTLKSGLFFKISEHLFSFINRCSLSSKSELFHSIEARAPKRLFTIAPKWLLTIAPKRGEGVYLGPCLMNTADVCFFSSSFFI